MLLKELMIFDLLSTPVWVVHPFKEAVVYSNQASRTLSGAMSLDEMRKGTLSSCPQRSLQNYLYYFKNIAEVFEVWTIQTPEGLSPIYCKTTLIKSEEYDTLILFEAVKILQQNDSFKALPAHTYKRRSNSFFSRFFMTSSAPMLLIDPEQDGRIIDANIAALRFL
ncbi:Probable diguanylate cyclase YdaM [Raoultella planticola]|nr:Probable diguanylate cyclase YdaM [Raoultella planticola]